MRLTNLCALAAVFAIAAACSHEPTKPTGPVTLKFTTPIVGTQAAPDTLVGYLVLDNTDSINVPFDTLPNVTRGDHTVRLRLTSEYMERAGTLHVDPTGSVALIDLDPLRACRIFSTDSQYCLRTGNIRRNLLYTPGRLKLLCSANDYGEYCNAATDPQLLGAVWPRDSTFNAYASTAKLLLAGIVGPELPSAGHRIAMGLYGYGDYSPMTRLSPVGADSTRYQNEVWSDARHFPVFTTLNAFQVPLARDDRPDDRFGLGVIATYYQPVAFPDAIFVRYDVTNVSATATYRFSHRTEPAGGHTIQQLYLTPMIDADIGGTDANESVDDNATVFPADNIVAAYDQTFNVSTFSGTTNKDYVTRPGLLGMQFISASSSAQPVAIIAPPDSLSYYSSLTETGTTFPILAGGREGPASASSCVARGTALYVCVPETGGNVAIGYSVGPIPSLAPGQSTTLTIAILMAPPKTGEFTSGTSVAPQNDLPDDTSRQIYRIAENLRTLAAQTKSVMVAP